MNGRIYGFLDFIVSLASEFRKCVLMLTHFLAMFPFTRPPSPLTPLENTRKHRREDV